MNKSIRGCPFSLPRTKTNYRVSPIVHVGVITTIQVGLLTLGSS